MKMSSLSENGRKSRGKLGKKKIPITPVLEHRGNRKGGKTNGLHEDV
jgi:hypothetical protein